MREQLEPAEAHDARVTDIDLAMEVLASLRAGRSVAGCDSWSRTTSPRARKPPGVDLWQGETKTVNRYQWTDGGRSFLGEEIKTEIFDGPHRIRPMFGG